MSGHNSKNLLKAIASLLGVASASALLSFPALALNQPFNQSVRGSQSNPVTKQFLAQTPTGSWQFPSGSGSNTGTEQYPNNPTTTRKHHPNSRTVQHRDNSKPRDAQSPDNANHQAEQSPNQPSTGTSNTGSMQNSNPRTEK